MTNGWPITFTAKPWQDIIAGSGHGPGQLRGKMQNETSTEGIYRPYPCCGMVHHCRIHYRGCDMLTLRRLSRKGHRPASYVLESAKGILACVHGKQQRLAVEAAAPSMPFKPWWSIDYQRNAVRSHLRASGVVLGKYSD